MIKQKKIFYQKDQYGHNSNKIMTFMYKLRCKT